MNAPVSRPEVLRLVAKFCGPMKPMTEKELDAAMMRKRRKPRFRGVPIRRMEPTPEVTP